MRREDTAAGAPLVIGTAQLTATVTPGAVVMHLTGEVDLANSAQLTDALVGTRGENARVEIDASALAFCDVSGARALVEAGRRLGATGTCLTLSGACPQLQWILSLVGAGQDLCATLPPPPTVTLPSCPGPSGTSGPSGSTRREHRARSRPRLPDAASPRPD